MNLLELSQNIREVRRRQGMTVEALAKESGFSKGFISQIENFRITPSLKALARISEALGVTMESLFSLKENPVRYTFGTLDEGKVLHRDDDERFGIVYKALAHQQLGRSMDPFVIEYTPAPPREFMSHDTEEFFLLMEGALDYFVYDDSNRHQLKAGDTVYLRSGVPHRVQLPSGCCFAKALLLYSAPQE